MINCTDSEVKPFREHLSYTDMELHAMRSLHDNDPNISIMYGLWISMNELGSGRCLFSAFCFPLLFVVLFLFCATQTFPGRQARFVAVDGSSSGMNV